MLDRITTNGNGYSSHPRISTLHTTNNEGRGVQVTPLKTQDEQRQTEQNITEQMNKEKVEEVVKGINDFLTPTHTSLKFEFHEKLNEYYVTIVDDQSKTVVKEIPSKKLLDFYAAMTDFIGIMVDKKI